MQVSPLQPTAIFFQKISVEPYPQPDGSFVSAQEFDFAGVAISCDTSYAETNQVANNDEQPSVLITAHLQLRNETGKPAPYTVDMIAVGAFRWLDPNASDERRRDITVVNGNAVLYGALREMLLTVSSRCVSGPLFLPSVNFLDNKPSLKHEVSVPEPIGNQEYSSPK